MSARWKRNMVVAVMAVLVCSAVALNWMYTGKEVQDASGKLLGEAQLVSGSGADGRAEDGGAQEGADPAAAGDAGALTDEGAVYAGSDYFASARLTRQQARDNALSLLQEAAGQEDADAAVANEASEGIQALASCTLKEAQIENLVTAKGYADCVAFMGENSISVVVSAAEDGLQTEDVAKIKDIILSETDYTVDQIKIMEAT